MWVAAGLVASPFTTAAAAGAQALSLLELYHLQWQGGVAGDAACWLAVLPAQQVALGVSLLAPGCATEDMVPHRLQKVQGLAAQPTLVFLALGQPPARVLPLAEIAGAARAQLGLRP